MVSEWAITEHSHTPCPSGNGGELLRNVLGTSKQSHSWFDPVALVPTPASVPRLPSAFELEGRWMCACEKFFTWESFLSLGIEVYNHVGLDIAFLVMHYH